MVGPLISNVRPAPPDKYVVDYKLSPGAVDQTDWSHDGFDVSLKRAITTPDGQVKTDSFPSHYVPWHATFHVGPGGAPAAASSAA